DGAGVAPDRAPSGRPRHRTGVRAGDRVADAGGTEAGAGGSGRHGVKNGDRRVVVTGVGAVTPIGTAADGLWSGLTSRRSAVRGVTRFDPAPFRSRIAAEIPDFRPQDHLEAKRARRLDRFSQLAVTCARLALQGAELRLETEDRDRFGAMMGSALGGVAFAEAQVPKYLAEGPRGLDASLALAVFPGAASCNIAIEFGLTGPNATNAMSCASGTIAVGEAFHVVRDGRADVMLAGGAEAPLAPLTFAAVSNIPAMLTRNAAQRLDRHARDQAGVRRPRVPAGGERHQGLLRPRPGRERGDRGGDLRSGAAARLAAPDAQPATPGSRVRLGLPPRRRPTRRPGRRGRQLVRLWRRQRHAGVATRLSPTRLTAHEPQNSPAPRGRAGRDRAVRVLRRGGDRGDAGGRGVGRRPEHDRGGRARRRGGDHRLGDDE